LACSVNRSLQNHHGCEKSLEDLILCEYDGNHAKDACIDQLGAT